MTDYSELKRLAERVISDRRFCGDETHKTLAHGVMSLAADKDAWIELVGAVCATIPLRDISSASLSGHSMVDYFRALQAERDQLKAENDLLREKMSIAALEIRKASSWICREVEAGTKSATHWAVRLRENADKIDAAMSKGEQP